MISLIVISGRSGSGKSTALHVLEDMGFYCIDNLPVTLLRPLIERLVNLPIDNIAVSIDARNIQEDLADKLYAYFNSRWRNVQIRHRELGTVTASSIDESV